MLSICDRALDSRNKKRVEELSTRELPEDETLGESISHFDPPQCREEDYTTTLRWLVVGAENFLLKSESEKKLRIVPSLVTKVVYFRVILEALKQIAMQKIVAKWFKEIIYANRLLSIETNNSTH